MTVVSGILGTVDGVSSIRRWLVKDRNDVVQYASSATRSAIDAMAGNTDWEGLYVCFGHTPAVAPGDTFTFKGTVDGTLGLTGTGMVDVVRIDWPVEAGQPISYIVGFSPGTAMTALNEAISDTSTALPPTAISCKIQVANDAASPAYADMSGEEREMHLTIARDNRPTPTGRTAGLKSRVAGHWRGEVEFTAYAASPAALPQKGQTIGLRIYVNASLYWEVRWWEIDEKSDDVKVEGSENYSCRIHAVFRARGGGGVGAIVTPAGTTWWPE